MHRIIKKLSDALVNAPAWSVPLIGIAIILIVTVTSPIWLLLLLGVTAYDLAVGMTGGDDD
jgi:hypothetical protein